MFKISLQRFRSLLSGIVIASKILWAAPVTIPCLTFYALPFWALGWYKLLGTAETSLVFVCSDMPLWLEKQWQGWAGHSMGNCIVLRVSPDSYPAARRTLVHELFHAKQVMKWGIFQPIAYAASSLTCWMAGEDPYRMNIFEVAARRAAGQKI